ncbi:MAG: hypothetical protein ACFFBD_20960 [Candidatus Hodarchaeota archaeon]
MALNEIKTWLQTLGEPFLAKEAPAGKDATEKHNLLNTLVKDGILKKKKISTSFVYFRPYETLSPPPADSAPSPKSKKDEIKTWLQTLGEPFLAKEAPAGKDATEKHNLLNTLVKDGILKKKKISTSFVYFRPYEALSPPPADSAPSPVKEKKEITPQKEKAKEPAVKKEKETPIKEKKEEPPEKSKDNSARQVKELEIKLAAAKKENETLELQIQELKHELQDERKKMQKLKLHDAHDDPWREVAWEMARVLSEMRGITTKEALQYFGAPEEDE